MQRKKENRHPPPQKKNQAKTNQVVSVISREYCIALAIVLLISFLVYLPVFHNGFVWDDEAYIKNNPLVFSFNLKEIFSQYVVGNYHPFTVLLLAAEYHFFGLNETGYHTVNLLFHLLNVILVFYAVFLLSDKAIIALVASLMFGIHPLHVESVAWAAELKDLLYAFFFLASYIFYIKYLKKLQKKFYICALLLFSVSLLSKAMAVSLPLVLILTDYFKGRKINTKTLLEKVPFFLLALGTGVVAVLAQKSTDAISDITIIPFTQRIIYAAYGYITYLFKLMLPQQLSAFYPYPVKNGDDVPIYYYAYVISFLGLTAFAIYSLRFSKKIFFGIGFFTATVFFVLQLLPVGKVIMADRYSYIPSIGFFYLAGEVFNFLWNKKLQLAAIILLGSFTVLFSVKTYARCMVWNNNLTLWNDVIRQYQTIAYAYNNRGIILFNEKRNDEGLSDLNKAIELKPDYPEAYYNRGIVFINEQRNNEALHDFNKAIELKPYYPEAYYNRGIVFINEKRNNEALHDFNKAIEMKPNNPDAYNNRGTLFITEKRNDEALKDFNKAIELKPSYSDAYVNRGNLFLDEKRYEEALQDLNKAIGLKPDNFNAYINRGVLFINMKRFDEAINDFNKAIELQPGDPSAYNNRGITLINIKRYDEALYDFNKAIELKPDYADAYNNREFLLKMKRGVK